MAAPKKPMDIDRLERAVKAARENNERRQRGFRERALRLFPWICARCGREFSRENVRELTVHHKDHDHDNNPPDGNNWELLCLYCHEQEHDHRSAQGNTERMPGSGGAHGASHKPFEGLDALLKKIK